MGTTDRGIYLPANAETGWGEEIDADLSRLADLGINAKAYGAVGGGVADDSAAIQAALNTGQHVLLPDDVYGVGTELVSGADGQRIIGTGLTSVDGTGPGTGGSVLKALSGIRSILRLSHGWMHVEGLTLDGNGTATNGLLLHNARRSRLSSVIASDCVGYGVRFDISAEAPTGNNNSVILDKVVATGNDGTGIGIPTWQSDNNVITLLACVATANGVHGAWIAGGVQVIGGQYDDNVQYGIKLGNSADATTTVGVNLLQPHIEGNDVGGILADKCSRVNFWREDSGGDTVDWTNSVTPSGITEYVQTSTGLRFKSGASGRSIEIGGGARTITVGSDLDTDLSLILTPKGTGAGSVVKLTTGGWINGPVQIDGALNHDGSTVGFYGTAPVAKQTGVAVTAAGVHAALVNLGLISA